MAPPDHRDYRVIVKAAGAVSGLIGGILLLTEFADRFVAPAVSFPRPAIDAQLVHLIGATVAVCVVYGLLWTGVEKACQLAYGAGASKTLPRDMHAIVLSIAVSCAVLCGPPIYQWLFEVRLFPVGRFAWIVLVVMIGDAVAHLIIYGTRWSWLPGIAHTLRAESGVSALRRHTVNSFLYYATIVILVAVPFRGLGARPSNPRLGIDRAGLNVVSMRHG